MNWNPFGERRIGKREPAQGEVGWRGPGRPPRWRRHRDQSEPRARVVEISLTGARLVVPAGQGLVPGAHAAVDVNGHSGVVEIRWVKLDQNGRDAIVGVEFEDLSPQLAKLIHGVIAGDRGSDIDWHWQSAH